MLTSYNGTSITYDAIGNPTNWRNAAGLTWEARELQRTDLATGAYVDYTYNSDGIRTSRAYVNANTKYREDRTYILDGSKIIQENIKIATITSTTNATLYYLYDTSGEVQGFIYNNSYYYFQKNLQGDVVRILNSSGTVVTEYTYDAWGLLLSTSGSMASTVGKYNPFRYRSYYYDTETGFYYLQSRYYDPTVGRFLNADVYVATGQGIVGNNMFAYCNNNPVMYVDKTGMEPVTLTAGTAGAAVVIVTVVFIVVCIDYEAATDIIVGAIDWFSSMVDAISGALTSSDTAVIIPPAPSATDLVYDDADEAENIIESVLIQKLTNYDGKNKSSHVHHIVAQNDHRASIARTILQKVLPGGVSNALNLITVKQPIHQRLHTSAYYDLVNLVIYDAYISAGLDEEKQRENVTNALIELRIFIASLNSLCPD